MTQASKVKQIHPSAVHDKGSSGKDGNRGIQKKISLLDPESQGAKELNANLSKNAKLEKDFNECFSTLEQRLTFFRSARFLEKHLVNFANKSTKVSQETLHFSREFIRGVRLYLEGDPVDDATAKEKQDLDENDHKKVKVKEKEKEDDPLNKISFQRTHSVVEQMAQRETAEIKFTFKRVITSNHEPYEVITKNTFGKWLLGEKWAKRIMNTTKGWYGIAWFIVSILNIILATLFLLKSIPVTQNLLLVCSFLFCALYSLIMISSINVLLCQKLLQEFMFWYTSLSFIVGVTLAAMALTGPQRLAVISTMPVGIAFAFVDSMPRFFVEKLAYGYPCIILFALCTIVTLKQLPNNPKLDFHMPIFGTYNGTGIAINALLNYIIMMTKLFVVSLWNPKMFLILRVSLHNIKMMQKRADMILVTAEKEKLYKKMGEDGQKLMTAIVGSPSDVPWEFNKKTSKYMLFTRFRIDERRNITNEWELKLEMYTRQTLKQAYRHLHIFEDYKVLHKGSRGRSTSFPLPLAKALSPGLPRMQILYRRIKVPYPGVSDRLVCIKVHYRCYPEHGFAFAVSQDAEKKYWNQIPKEVAEGTIVAKIRLGGYVLEKMNSKKPMTKVTYFVSSDIGGWIPVRVRNLKIQEETTRIVKIWDEQKWNGEDPALFTTKEVMQNIIGEGEGARLAVLS
eukprot:g1161.t1